MLRKIAVAAIALLFVVSISFAAKGDLSYGAKFGINMASATLSSTPAGVSVKSRTGMGLGAIINYNLNEKMDIRTDILYLQKGAKLEWPGGGTTWKLDYLTIDPYFTYKFAKWDCKVNKGHDAHAFFEIGPDLSFKMSAKDDNGNKITDAKGMDLGLNIGVGVAAPIGKGYLMPELRYNMGLTKSLDGTAGSAKNNGIGIMFGYMF